MGSINSRSSQVHRAANAGKVGDTFLLPRGTEIPGAVENHEILNAGHLSIDDDEFVKSDILFDLNQRMPV